MPPYTWMRIPLLVLLSGLLLATSVQAEPVKLAVLLPLSHVRKDIGHRVKQGFLLGIQEEVAAHQVPWDAWVTFDFLDNRSDEDHSLKLAKEAMRMERRRSEAAERVSSKPIQGESRR